MISFPFGTSKLAYLGRSPFLCLGDQSIAHSFVIRPGFPKFFVNSLFAYAQLLAPAKLASTILFPFDMSPDMVNEIIPTSFIHSTSPIWSCISFGCLPSLQSPFNSCSNSLRESRKTRGELMTSNTFSNGALSFCADADKLKNMVHLAFLWVENCLELNITLRHSREGGNPVARKRLRL